MRSNVERKRPMCSKKVKNRTRGKSYSDKEKRIYCAKFGHSRIQTQCFGYYYCARCSAQVGDSLGSVYPGASEAVVIGHKCPTCRANFKKLTKHDKAMLGPEIQAEGYGTKKRSTSAVRKRGTGD